MFIFNYSPLLQSQIPGLKMLIEDTPDWKMDIKFEQKLLISSFKVIYLIAMYMMYTKHLFYSLYLKPFWSNTDILSYISTL